MWVKVGKTGGVLATAVTGGVGGSGWVGIAACGTKVGTAGGPEQAERKREKKKKVKEKERNLRFTFYWSGCILDIGG
jgi:hypothetical protein